MPKSWKTFEPTVSAKSWERIKYYIEETQADNGLSYYRWIHSWYEMATVLSMYENNIPASPKYDELIEDYKVFLEETVQ